MFVRLITRLGAYPLGLNVMGVDFQSSGEAKCICIWWVEVMSLISCGAGLEFMVLSIFGKYFADKPYVHSFVGVFGCCVKLSSGSLEKNC